jgi:hypothetical protein
MKTLFTLLFLLTITSCHQPVHPVPIDNILKNNSDGNKKQTLQSIKLSLTDSIGKYYDSVGSRIEDSNQTYVIYITDQYIVLAITDSSLFLFRKVYHGWIQQDSAKFNDHALSFDTPDLNGDDEKDIVVYGTPDAHGQSAPYVFLSDSINNWFLNYRPDIHLYNIRYNPQQKLVQSYYQGGVTDTNDKEYYQWINDSLKLVRGVEEDLSNTNNAYPFVVFYKLKGRKRVTYKRQVDKTGAIYDTALWKNDY